MKTTKLLKSTLGVAAVAIAASVGIFAYEKHQQQELAMANPLLAENLAALTEDTILILVTRIILTNLLMSNGKQK